MGSFPYRKTAFSSLTQSHHEYNKKYPRLGSPMYDKWQEITYITSSIRNNEPNTEEGKNKLTLYPVGFEPTSFKTDIPSWPCGSVGRAMGDLFKGRGSNPTEARYFFLFLSLSLMVPCFLFWK